MGTETRLSTNAEKFLNSPPGILQDEAFIVNVDLYDRVTNPNGFIKLGIAESKLCEDLMQAKMKELQKLEEDVSLMYYSDTRGTPQFRTAVKRFLERFFKPNHPIDIENIHCMAPTSTLEMLAFCLANPGECFMTLSPFYYNLHEDIMARAGVDIVTVPVTAMGKKIRAMVILNPHNPVGYILTKKQILDILHFANK